MFCDSTNVVRNHIIIDMDRFLAVAADEKDAIMMAARMCVRDIGVGAFYTHGDVVDYEQIQDAVNAVGRHPLAPRLGNVVRNVIGGCRFLFGCKRLEYRGAHGGPLLILSFQRVTGRVCQACAGRFVMMMLFGHIS